MTTVVHCKREPYDIYIGRPSIWGNPFPLRYNNSRESVLAQYTKYLMSRPDLIERARRELKDKVLGCWCHPQLCHGDILARICNERQ